MKNLFVMALVLLITVPVFAFVENGDDVYFSDLTVRGTLMSPFAVARMLSVVVAGNAEVGGDLEVTGNVTADSVVVTGDLTVLADTNVVVTGDLDVGGNAAVTGNAAVGDTLDVTGPAYVGGEVEVTGNLTALAVFTSAVSNILGPTVVTGMLETDSLTVNDYMLFSGDAVFEAGSTVDFSAMNVGDLDLGGANDTVEFTNINGDTLTLIVVNGMLYSI